MECAINSRVDNSTENEQRHWLTYKAYWEERKRSHGHQWVCHKCVHQFEAYGDEERRMKRRRTGVNEDDDVLLSLPDNASTNHLWPGVIPVVLKDLNRTELSMIALINPVISYVCLGGYKGNPQVRIIDTSFIALMANDIAAQNYGVRDKVFSVMADVVAVAEVLPRMPTLDSIALLKSSAANKKLYDFRPERVRAALKWLKKNNRFYEDVEIDYSLLTQCESFGPPSMDMSSDEEEDYDECGENDACATNEGAIGCDNEIMVMPPDRVEEEAEGMAEGLTGRRPVVTRPNPERPTYITPNSDKFFYEKAFPHLYPYGYGGPGDDHGMKNDT